MLEKFLSLIIILIPSVFIALLVTQFARRAWQCRLRGALVLPVLGLLPSMLFHLTHIYDWLTHLAILNAGTFKFPGPWRSKLITANPANIEYVLREKYHTFGKGDDYKTAFRDFLGDSLLVNDGDHFRSVSKSVAIALTSPDFRKMVSETLPITVHEKLLPIFSKASQEGTVIDLEDVFHRLAFDNICINAFGIDPGSLSPDLHEVPFLESFVTAVDCALYRITMPPFSWKFLRFLNIGLERRFRVSKNLVYKFVEELYIRWRVQDQDGRPRSDILFATAQVEKAAGRLYSEKALQEFMVNIILAGKDTVPCALTWFFYLVGKHPDVEDKILEEMEEIINERREMEICRDPDPFSFEEVKQMHYLHAALSESLRLYPPVPIEIVEAGADEVLPDGTAVKKGEQLVYLIYSSGRMQNLWGKDCLEFKPERWLKNGRFVREQDFKFPVFNGGPRRCTGREFAYWQMKWAAASIIVRYRVKVVRKGAVFPKFGFSLHTKDGLPVTICPRHRQRSSTCRPS